MIKKRFICKKCNHVFEVDLYEEGEAEEKNEPTSPVRCPRCRGPVERAK